MVTPRSGERLGVSSRPFGSPERRHRANTASASGGPPWAGSREIAVPAFRSHDQRNSRPAGGPTSLASGPAGCRHPHPVLYTAPSLTSEDEGVLGEIHRMRKDLRHVLRTPRRWEGGLRRSALARAIRAPTASRATRSQKTTQPPRSTARNRSVRTRRRSWRPRSTVRPSDTSWRWVTRTTPRSTPASCAPCTT